MDELMTIKKARKKVSNNEIKIRFDLVGKSNLQDKQIFLSCSLNGISFRYYSGYRTPAENFEKKREKLSGGVIYVCRAKKNTFNKDGVPATEINRRLDKLRLAAIKVYDEFFKSKPESFNKENFTKLLAIELGENSDKSNVKNQDEKTNDNNSRLNFKRIDKAQQFTSLNYANIENLVNQATNDNILIENENKKLPNYIKLISNELMDGTSIFYWYHFYATKMKVSPNRTRHYHSDIKRLKIYSDTLNEPLNFDNIDLEDYFEYLDDGHRCINTRVAIMKRLRAFFRYCRIKIKVIKFNPFEEIIFSDAFGSEEYDEPVCMTRNELTRLYEYDFSNNPHFELVKDMFCLQASIGCRVGDFMRFSYDNIDNGILSYYAHKTRDKKLTKISVPLSKRAKEIIKKYKNKKVRDKYRVDKDDLIMPFINSVEYNKTLKDVFNAAKLKRTVVLYNREEKSEEMFELWELATSHMARRTFIDILFQAGVSLSVIASMSGHTEDSKALSRYKTQPRELKKQAVTTSMD